MSSELQQLIAIEGFFLIDNHHVAFLSSSLNLIWSSVLLLNNRLERLQNMCYASELNAFAEHNFSKFFLSHQMTCENI